MFPSCGQRRQRGAQKKMCDWKIRKGESQRRKSLKTQLPGEELNQCYIGPADYTCIKTKTWVEISAFTYCSGHLNLIKLITC